MFEAFLFDYKREMSVWWKSLNRLECFVLIGLVVTGAIMVCNFIVTNLLAVISTVVIMAVCEGTLIRFSVTKKSVEHIELRDFIIFIVIAIIAILGVSMQYFCPKKVLSLLFLIIAGTLLIYELRAYLISRKENNRAGAVERESSNLPIPEKGRQMWWFKTHRIDKVRELVSLEVDIPRESYIDLLVDGCTHMQEKQQTSEIVKKRLRPILVLSGILFSILFNAYMYRNQLAAPTQDTDVTSILDTLKTFFSSFTTLISGNGATFNLFVLLAIVLIVYLIFIVFVMEPIASSFFDKDWTITQEIKDALLYIKAETNTSAPSELENKNGCP